MSISQENENISDVHEVCFVNVLIRVCNDAAYKDGEERVPAGKRQNKA